MNKALAAVLAAGLLGLGATAFADSPQEKYRKHMKEYYEALAEAQEEAEDGDWDDYREEMRKAEKEFHRAQRYAPQHRPPCGYPMQFGHGPQFGAYGPSYGSPYYGSHGYYAPRRPGAPRGGHGYSRHPGFRGFGR